MIAKSPKTAKPSTAASAAPAPRAARPATRRRTADARNTFREQARAALRSEGHRMTRQRDTVFDVIAGAGAHLDADEIYRLARERDPRISLSTVYRTLAVLKRERLVDELHLSEEHHHYEARPAEPHYHLLCTNCGSVEEVSGQEVAQFQESLAKRHGFAVTSLQLDIGGVCRKCREQGVAA
jgi:Fe2+ or Zn2+ uptake regulation protein